MKIIIWISRVFVGLLFIFSGFIKANDALGFSYKLEEYFEKFSSIFNESGLEFLAYPMDWMAHISLPLAMIIVISEIVLGVLTLIGAYMEKVTKLLFAMIIFFTVLTFVSWYFEIVKTCGCFGEAIPLTPFESFIKDLILLVLIVILFIFRKSVTSLCSVNGDKISLFAATALSTLFTFYCYQHLPILDFRAYAPGNSLKKGMEIKKGNPLTMYTLKNKGNEVVVSFADYPQDFNNWEYISSDIIDGELTVYNIKIKATGQETRVIEIPEEFKLDWEVVSSLTQEFIPDKDPVIQQLSAFYYKELDHDYLDVMFENEEPYFWLVLRKLDDFGDFVQADDGIHFLPNSYGLSAFKDIKLFASNANKSNVKFHVMSSEGVYERIEAFKHGLEINFQFYVCDDTELKTMIRSSPGLVLLKSDTVISKWHFNDFTNFEEINNQYINK